MGAIAICLAALGAARPAEADSSIGIGTPLCPGAGPVFCFSPVSVTEMSGATITWTNNTPGLVHTATSCDPQSCGGQSSPDVFHTGDIPYQQSVSIRLTTPGIYHYFCTHHPFVTATITILPNQLSTTTASVPPPRPGEGPQSHSPGLPGEGISTPAAVGAGAPTSTVTPPIAGNAIDSGASRAKSSSGAASASAQASANATSSSGASPSSASRKATTPAKLNGNPLRASGPGSNRAPTVIGGALLLAVAAVAALHAGLRRLVIRLVR